MIKTKNNICYVCLFPDSTPSSFEVFEEENSTPPSFEEFQEENSTPHPGYQRFLAEKLDIQTLLEELKKYEPYEDCMNNGRCDRQIKTRMYSKKRNDEL